MTERKLQVGDLRVWLAITGTRANVPFLVTAIDGRFVTILEGGVEYEFTEEDLNFYSEPMEEDPDDEC
jgi:hypothetical protein